MKKKWLGRIVKNTIAGAEDFMMAKIASLALRVISVKIP